MTDPDFPREACYFFGGHPSGPCRGPVTEASSLCADMAPESDLYTHDAFLASVVEPGVPFCEKHYLVDLRQRR